MITICPFTPPYQEQAKALILQGLEERWGTINPALNPDLNDIAHSYADGYFVLAFVGEQLVGTGALIPEEQAISRIVRMSVHQTHRRKGIAQAILHHLIMQAKKQGDKTIVLETTANWQSAILFYQQAGFQSLGVWNGDHHFCLPLSG